MKLRTISFFVLTALLMSAAGCSKSKSGNDDGNYGNNPRSAVPDDLVGYWISGSTSIGNFWGYDGSYQGAGFEIATGYMLYKDGRAREYFYYTNTNSGCRSQVLGYKEGTVELSVANKTFRFYPASGNYRTYQSCGGSQNGKSKQYGADELYPEVMTAYEDIDFKKEGGKIKSWHIYFDDGSAHNFTKGQEPQK